MEAITRWWIFVILAGLVLLLAGINIFAGNMVPGVILVLLALTLAARGILKRRRR